MNIAVRRQRGQSLVETLIVLPIFGVFMLGIFQATLFYRAKALLDYAALEAAREGTVAFAQQNAMRKGLVRGLLPLYAHGTGTRAYLDAHLKASLDVAAGAASIEIVNPTREAFDDWKVRQFDGIEGIPNDSLAFRSTRIGARSGLSVQDANLLKIKVTYNFPLIVPVVDRLIGRYDVVRSVALGHDVYTLPIVASATLPMQTPIRDRRPLPEASAVTAP